MLNLKNVLMIAVSVCVANGVIACGDAKKPKQPYFPSIDGLSAEALKTQCHKGPKATHPKTNPSKSLQGSLDQVKLSQPRYLKVDVVKNEELLQLPDDAAYSVEVSDLVKPDEVGLNDLDKSLEENKK